MLHSIVLEKNRPSSRDMTPESTNDTAIAPEQDFVYMLIPETNGYRVLRTPLERFLEIAEPVSEIPQNADGREVTLVSESHSRGVHERSHRRKGGRSSATISSRSWHGDGISARFGSIEIDSAARVVKRAGENVALAPREFDLLVALFERGGAAASRRELMREIWGDKGGSISRTVDTHIFNLRRKLEEDPGNPVHLLTVSKIGYRLKA
jgi:hypothetical protein